MNSLEKAPQVIKQQQAQIELLEKHYEHLLSRIRTAKDLCMIREANKAEYILDKTLDESEAYVSKSIVLKKKLNELVTPNKDNAVPSLNEVPDHELGCPTH
jgi:hypothetical protein